MKRILPIVLTLACASAWAQDISPNPNGGTPGGTAGGDLSGTYPNPTIKSSVTLTTPNIGAATGSSLNLGTGSITAALPSSIFASLPSASTNTGVRYRVTDVGINGSEWFSNGTKWSPVNGSVVLVQSGMPWVVLSSGSISAAGAISGITALIVGHAQAWCYLPANIVATVASAGWRYCTFASTTTGTVFLDQPAATFPITWPSSPTAVTDGKGSYTGVTSSVALPTVAVKANTMGINGRLELYASTWQTTATTTSVGLNLNGGINSATPTSGATANDFSGSVENTGATGNQLSNMSVIGVGAKVNQNIYSANTTTDLTATVNLTASAVTSNSQLINFRYILLNDGQ